jgi:hypothetical protein
MNEVRHPSRAAVLVSQNRAASIARDATTARANNDKYLDLVARTAADQHATAEITGLAGACRPDHQLDVNPVRQTTVLLVVRG